MPSGDVLVLIDEGGRVVEWGRPAEELFGWSAEEAVGRSVTSLTQGISADRPGRREGLLEKDALLVKPLLSGTSVVWQVLASGDTPAAQDLAVLKALFAHSPVAFHVLDDRLRVVRTNTASDGSSDTPAGHLLGRPFTEAWALEDAVTETAVAQGVLDSGCPVLNRLVRGARASGRPGRHIQSVSYFRLEDSRGHVLGLVATAVDVTERERAACRLALLEQVRSRVGHVPNVGVICQELVDAVVPAFADLAVVEVVNDVVRGEDPPQVPVRQDVPLRRAAFRGGVTPAYPLGEVRPLPPGTPFSFVLSDLQPRLVPIEENSSWPAADPARADAIRRSGAHSLIVAPLALRGQALGVVSLYRCQDQDPFDEEDIALASAVCAHAALCIENARRYMREWIIASTVQHRLLPQDSPAQTTVEISQLHLPGPEGGGAWSDAIALPGARTALIVGDVAGEGMLAAVMMGLVRTAIHTLAALDLPPDELLARLSDSAARVAPAYASLPVADPEPTPLAIGCVIAVYDPVELTCTIARAGLAKPVAVLPDGSTVTLPVPPGPLLTGADNAPFPATTVVLPEGTTLAMGTAAVADRVLAPSGPLRPLLDGAGTRPLSDLRDAVAQACPEDHRLGESMLLLARTKALPADRVLTRALPEGPEAAPIARAETRRRLEAWGMDEETAFTTELIVSEFVGNAVRYGAPPMHLRLILDRMLTCEVSDAAPSAPHVKHARTLDETGRGLFIIASLGERWGTRYQADGKTVWAEQPVKPPRAGP